MKKVLAAALLCAVSSFATWDLFPAQEAGKGEAKLGFSYHMPAEKFSAMALNLGARYTIIEGLEAAVMLSNGDAGFILSQSYDGESLDDASGLNQPIIGVRYWLPMGLGIAVDAILPVGSEDIVGDEPQFGLDVGLQFSTKFNEQLSFGSEAMFSVLDKANADVSNGVGLNVAVEVDYSLGSVIPWVGLDLDKGLTKGDLAEAAPLGFGFSVGATYDITQSMYAQVGYWMGVAGDQYKDYSPKVVNINYGLKF